MAYDKINKLEEQMIPAAGMILEKFDRLEKRWRKYCDLLATGDLALKVSDSPEEIKSKKIKAMEQMNSSELEKDLQSRGIDTEKAWADFQKILKAGSPVDTECTNCGIGFSLPSGKCDHCDMPNTVVSHAASESRPLDPSQPVGTIRPR